jgi:endonuclease IV
MKISKAHQRLADRINSQEVLTHPGDYLGPNWEAVINFWLYLDALTEEQLNVFKDYYFNLSSEERDIASNKVLDVSRNVCYAIGAGYVAFTGIYMSSYVKLAIKYATLELICFDKLLEQGYQPVFFPMFLDTQRP